MEITELQKTKGLLNHYAKLDDMEVTSSVHNGELIIKVNKIIIEITDAIIRERLQAFRIDTGREPNYIITSADTYRQMAQMYSDTYRVSMQGYPFVNNTFGDTLAVSGGSGGGNIDPNPAYIDASEVRGRLGHEATYYSGYDESGTPSNRDVVTGYDEVTGINTFTNTSDEDVMVDTISVNGIDIAGTIDNITINDPVQVPQLPVEEEELSVYGIPVQINNNQRGFVLSF